VAGSDAFMLSTFLRRANFEAWLGRLSATSLDRGRLVSLRDAVDTIVAAAADYTACVDANAQVPVAQVEPELAHDDEWITTNVAADLLKVSPSRVRQIRKAHLEWRAVGRQYEVTRSSVLIYGETRRRAA
jgi:hypothetical protein